MGEHKEAVVVGALGVIGRYIVERLLRQDDWSVIGLSRRAAGAVPRYRHISVDLLDREDVAAKLAGLTEATHVFYNRSAVNVSTVLGSGRLTSISQ